MDLHRILTVIPNPIETVIPDLIETVIPDLIETVIPDLIGDLLYNVYIFARDSKIKLLSGEFF